MPRTLLAALLLALFTSGQQPAGAQSGADLSGALRWRNIGPFRGGRVTAVAGMVSQPIVYYMGATGGGVWKTEDAGTSWPNISDGSSKPVGRRRGGR